MPLTKERRDEIREQMNAFGSRPVVVEDEDLRVLLDSDEKQAALEQKVETFLDEMSGRYRANSGGNPDA